MFTYVVQLERALPRHELLVDKEARHVGAHVGRLACQYVNEVALLAFAEARLGRGSLRHDVLDLLQIGLVLNERLLEADDAIVEALQRLLLRALLLAHRVQVGLDLLLFGLLFGLLLGLLCVAHGHALPVVERVRVLLVEHRRCELDRRLAVAIAAAAAILVALSGLVARAAVCCRRRVSCATPNAQTRRAAHAHAAKLETQPTQQHEEVQYERKWRYTQQNKVV